MEIFWQGFEKQAFKLNPKFKSALTGETAGKVRDLVALGMLAAPSVQKLTTGKDMKEKNYHALEVGGLGLLAAPYALGLGTKSYGGIKNLLKR